VVDFRSFRTAELEPDPGGTTVLTGANGSGKTSLLEAVGYAATLRSFRGAAREAMVRTGADRAIVRASFERDDRPVLVEAELAAGGRSRAQLNRQPVRSRHELARAVTVTVFSPEDLRLVQGPPAARRDLLDQALAALDPQAVPLLERAERVLRQRGALLRQAGGRAADEVLVTLDVWDERLAAVGEELAGRRRQLVAELFEPVTEAYGALAAAGDGEATEPVTLRYECSWAGPLADALAAARRDDLRRGVSTVGPHRDDLVLGLGGRDARTQASQGQQRCLALSLRLAVHRLVATETTSAPLLLLDDVFSELDPERSRALVRSLPDGPALLTTAVPLPGGVEVAKVVPVR
jgi:DNA replication and repair protein RecF